MKAPFGGLVPYLTVNSSIGGRESRTTHPRTAAAGNSKGRVADPARDFFCRGCTGEPVHIADRSCETSDRTEFSRTFDLAGRAQRAMGGAPQG